jgi:hypothetical protein
MDALNKRNPAASVTLGGELATGWDSSDRLPQRLESFAILKQRSDNFTAWAKSGAIYNPTRQQKKTILSLDTCGSFLLFRQYTSANRTRLIGGCTCKKHLLCALCASRRGVKNTQAYKEKFNQLQSVNPDLDVYFLTFTIKNGEDLLERFSHLRSSIQALLKKRNHQAASHRNIKTEMYKFIGGVFAYEFKRGSRENLWHPHIHMLALLPKGLRVDYEILKTEWLEITGDSSVINIQKAENDSAFLEVFAYALKFSEMENDDRWYASQLLANERLISSFGDVRGVVVDESNNDELLEDEEYYDLIFNWEAGRYDLAFKVENNPAREQFNRENAHMRSAFIRETQGA